MINYNKIYLADANELIKEIEDKSIDCIYVDVPYLYSEGGGGKSELSKRTEKKKFELKKANIWSGFDMSILDQYVRVMKKINMFIWVSKMQIPDVLNYFIDKGCTFDILVWAKTNPTPSTNNNWLPDLEYCIYFREKGVSLNDGYELKSKYYHSAINKFDKDQYDHPTIKPLDLVKRHILHATKEGDTVLDTFSGSGTTCVACKETNRNYIGMEINEYFYKISIDRLNGINVGGQTTIFTDFDNV